MIRPLLLAKKIFCENTLLLNGCQWRKILFVPLLICSLCNTKWERLSIKNSFWSFPYIHIFYGFISLEILCTSHKDNCFDTFGFLELGSKNLHNFLFYFFSLRKMQLPLTPHFVFHRRRKIKREKEWHEDE